MTSIEEIFERYNFLARDKSPDILISEIENVVGFLLPTDYKDYLLKYKQFEGSLGPEYFQLWEIENLITINNDYEIFNNLNQTIGIGTNLGGEIIGLEKFGETQYRIVLTPFIGLSNENNLLIGDSFSDFLFRLDNGKEWFDLYEVQ